MTENPPLRRELATVIEDAISPVLNSRLGPGLPSLRWNVCAEGGCDPAWSGQASAGEYAEDEAAATVREWATAFGFEAEQNPHGILEFRGWVGDVFVIVWGVVDRELFEKGLPSNTQE